MSTGLYSLDKLLPKWGPSNLKGAFKDLCNSVGYYYKPYSNYIPFSWYPLTNSTIVQGLMKVVKVLARSCKCLCSVAHWCQSYNTYNTDYIVWVYLRCWTSCQFPDWLFYRPVVLYKAVSSLVLKVTGTPTVLKEPLLWGYFGTFSGCTSAASMPTF